MVYNKWEGFRRREVPFQDSTIDYICSSQILVTSNQPDRLLWKDKQVNSKPAKRIEEI